MTMRAHLVSGLKWTAGAKVAGQVFTWAITLAVMRLLSPSDYGLLAMAGVFVAFLLMMAEAGLGPALIQKERLEAADLAQSFWIVIALDLALLVIVNIAAVAIAAFFHEPRMVDIFRVLSLQFLIMAVTVLPESMLARELRFRALSLVDLASSVAASVATLLLAFMHYGVWALVLGTMFGRLLRAVALNCIAPVPVRPKASLAGMRRMLRYAGNVTSARVLSYFFNQADVVVVGRLLGNETLGLYSVAMQVASMPVQRISAILNQITFPVVARYQNDRAGIADFVVRAARSLSLVAFPVLWGISCTASDLVEVVLGERWHDAAVPLQLLALMMPVKLVVNFLPAATDALGRPDLGFQNVLVAALIMPIAFIVGSHWGIIGVTCAWVIAYPPVLFFNMRRMLKVVGLQVRELLQVIAPALLCAGAMYVAVRATAAALAESSPVPRLACMITVGVVVYVVSTLMLNPRGYRDAMSVFRRSV